MSKKALANASAPIEGFFDRVDVVAEAMASTSAATAQEALVEALVPLSEPIFCQGEYPSREGCY